MKREFRKGRIAIQTLFDQELIGVELLVMEFSDLLRQADLPSADCERLRAIRLRDLPDAVNALQLAMKKAQMRAFPMDANGP